MLMPKRVKHRKQFRGSMRGKALSGNEVTYGQFGLVATEPCWIRPNQIEAARVAMTRHAKRGGQVWIKIFPDKPVTAKPAETRMGSGKGAVDYWVAVVKPGRVLFEIAGVQREVALEAMRLAMHKLPCKCKIVEREDVDGMELVSKKAAQKAAHSADEAPAAAEGGEEAVAAAPEAAPEAPAAEASTEGGDNE